MRVSSLKLATTSSMMMMLMTGSYGVTGKILYVEEGGLTNDGMDCEQELNPCGSIEAALNVAEEGDVVQIESGTYQYDTPIVMSQKVQLQVIAVSAESSTTASSDDDATYIHLNTVDVMSRNLETKSGGYEVDDPYTPKTGDKSGKGTKNGSDKSGKSGGKGKGSKNGDGYGSDKGSKGGGSDKGSKGGGSDKGSKGSKSGDDSKVPKNEKKEYVEDDEKSKGPKDESYDE